MVRVSPAQPAVLLHWRRREILTINIDRGAIYGTIAGKLLIFGQTCDKCSFFTYEVKSSHCRHGCCLGSIFQSDTFLQVKVLCSLKEYTLDNKLSRMSLFIHFSFSLKCP